MSMQKPGEVAALTRAEVMRIARAADIRSAGSNTFEDFANACFAAGAAAEREKAAEEGFAVACPQCEFRVAAAIRARRD